VFILQLLGWGRGGIGSINDEIIAKSIKHGEILKPSTSALHYSHFMLYYLHGN